MAAKKKPPTLTKADFERLAEWRYLLRRFLIFSENAAGEAGLTPQQHQALLAIKGYPGKERITIRELSDRLCVRHHTTVELLDRLTLKSLVARRSNPEDRRQVLIELTPEAEALLAELSAAHRAELKRLAPLLQVLFREFARETAGEDRVDARP